jgi:hypothetical protein
MPACARAAPACAQLEDGAPGCAVIARRLPGHGPAGVILGLVGQVHDGAAVWGCRWASKGATGQSGCRTGQQMAYVYRSGRGKDGAAEQVRRALDRENAGKQGGRENHEQKCEDVSNALSHTAAAQRQRKTSAVKPGSLLARTCGSCQRWRATPRREAAAQPSPGAALQRRWHEQQQGGASMGMDCSRTRGYMIGVTKLIATWPRSQLPRRDRSPPHQHCQ